MAHLPILDISDVAIHKIKLFGWVYKNPLKGSFLGMPSLLVFYGNMPLKTK